MLYCCTQSHTCETPGTGVAVRCWKWGQLQSYCCWRCRLLLATLLYTTAAMPWPVAMQMDQKMQQHLKTQEKKASQEFVRKCLLVHHANSLTRNFSGNSTRLLKLSAQKLSTFFEQWELQAGTYPLAVNWFKLSRFCFLVARINLIITLTYLFHFILVVATVEKSLTFVLVILSLWCHFVSAERNPSTLFDPELTFVSHISCLCKSAY